MKIAITADSHDHYENLRTAVKTANEAECQVLLHAGDLGAPGNSVDILKDFKGQVKMILGNNDHEIVGLMRQSQKFANFELIKTAAGGDSYEEELDGVKIFMHHYPRIAELAAHSGQFDVCIHGHTHRYREEMVGETLLINPSSVLPTPGPAGMVIYDTETKTHEKIVF